MKDRILILGNGFDLDLGLKTSYRDFCNSRYWPFNKLQYDYNYDGGRYTFPLSLSDALLLEKNNSTWFDIEATLGKYACLKRGDDRGYVRPKTLQQADIDRTQYESLVSNLRAYLQEVQEKAQINKDSIAAQVFRAVIENGYFNKIFTFNYTDLKSLALSIGIQKEFWHTHMHGTLEKGIILGIESRMDFDPLYRFMCKEYNPNYETRLLIRCLNEAQEIVIFGHSLSAIDYHYFQSFFKKQSEDILTKEQSKEITIFTYDTESQFDICDQLRNMNDRKLDSLFGNNILRIFRTSDCRNTSQYNKFLNHLRRTSKDTDHENLNRLASMI